MRRFAVLTAFILFILVFSSVSADESLPNPSVYSAGELAGKMPSYWIANYIEIQELMKNYPDFSCEHYSNPINGENFDQIICSSVNNIRTRDVIINFFFTGDHGGMTGLQEAVFSIETPTPADFHEVLEYFWLPGAVPQHQDAYSFHDTMTSLVFSTDTTVLRFDLPFFETDQGHFTTVDLWDSGSSRLGVG